MPCKASIELALWYSHPDSWEPIALCANMYVATVEAVDLQKVVATGPLKWMKMSQINCEPSQIDILMLYNTRRGIVP